MRKREYSGLPARLKLLRAQRSLSQYALAERLGLSRGIIGNYEIGARQPDFGTLCLIADFYEVSTDYLLGVTDVRERVITAAQRDSISTLVDGLGALSPEELAALEGSLRCRDILGDINSLSPDSLEDLKRYVALLQLRDESPTPGGRKFASA